jgi:hypothetical protein
LADLERFSVDDLVELGVALRGIDGGMSMAAVATEIVALLHEHLCDEHGRPGCADVQLLKTHPFGSLPPAAQALAAAGRPDPLDADVACLTTLARAGSAHEGSWSVEPLASVSDVHASPFLRAALADLHIDPSELLDPAVGQENELHRRPYGVFHVADVHAPGAPIEPERARQLAAGQVRSVVVLGAGLLSGDVFLLVISSRAPIDARVAKLLKTLTPAVKTALVPMTFSVFDARDRGVTA